MSPTKKDKSEFDWEKGGVLDDKSYDPVGDVRSKGLPKLSKAVHADPVLRKKERDQKILDVQSKPYQGESKDRAEDSNVIVEETHSGLLEGPVEDSKAKKLIDAGKQFKGVDRFGKKKD